MKKKFYNGMLLAAMLFVAISSFVSCKDYDEDAFADLQGTLEQLINSQVNDLTAQIAALRDAQEECKNNCEAWKQEIILWQQYVENSYVTLEEYNKHIEEYTYTYTKLAPDKAMVIVDRTHTVDMRGDDGVYREVTYVYCLHFTAAGRGSAYLYSEGSPVLGLIQAAGTFSLK